MSNHIVMIAKWAALAALAPAMLALQLDPICGRGR